MRLKGMSLLIPVLFLILAVLTGLALAAQPEDPMSRLTFTDTRRGLPLSPRPDEQTGGYTLYLPAYLDPEEVSLSTPWYLRAEFSPEEGLAAPAGTELTLTLRFLGRKLSVPFRVLRCSTDMTVYLEVKGNTIDYLNADQSHEGKVFTQFLDSTGETAYQGRATMTGRGNATWQWDKKPYNLEFSQPIDLGPFESIDKLCLLAEYFDSTKLRNAMAYHMGTLLEIPYASDYIFADVFINGQYNGLYGITTKKEYTKHVSSDGIQAVFELSTSGKGREWTTDMGKTVRLRFGSDTQIQYAVETMEEALLSRDWESLQEIIDLDSWARKYAMDELLYNYDLSLTSEYFYIDSRGKIGCMLPWDYEWVLYSRVYPYDFTQETALSAHLNRVNWYELLLENPAFRAAVGEALSGELDETLFSRLEDWLSQRAEEISGSLYCDHEIWRVGEAPDPDASRRAEQLRSHISGFRAGLDARKSYLLDVLRRWEDYCLITSAAQSGSAPEQSQIQLLLPKGTELAPCLPRLQQSLDTPPGMEPAEWTTAAGEAVPDILTEDIDLILHYRPIGQVETPVSEEAQTSPAPSAEAEAKPALPAPLRRMLAVAGYYRVYLLIWSPFFGILALLLVGEGRRIRRAKRSRAREYASSTEGSL